MPKSMSASVRCLPNIDRDQRTAYPKIRHVVSERRPTGSPRHPESAGNAKGGLTTACSPTGGQ
jgi:hypothetical protein